MTSPNGDAHESCQIWRHIDALPCQFNCWLEQLGPRQLPILLVNCLIAPQLTGNADPLGTCNGQVGNRAAAVNK